MPAEVETLMYAREIPWHRFGQKVEGLQTAEEAIVAAGLDWEVIQKPVYFFANNGKGRVHTKKFPERVVNVRAKDQEPFAVVSPGYKILQNKVAFDFADAIVETGEAKYETAGALRGGRVVFLSMEIPREVKVPGDDGEHRPYLLVCNSHDGSRALSARVTTIRVVCANTLNAALGDRTNEIKLRHTANVMDKVKEAQRALGLTYEYLDQFEIMAERMLLRKITPIEVLRTVVQVFPIKDVNPLKLSADELRRVIAAQIARHPAPGALRMVETSENIENVRNTAWGLWNGIAEYLDYGVNYRSRQVPAADNRATSILLGGMAASKKEQAAKILAALN